jgi:hypothetical protein
VLVSIAIGLNCRKGWPAIRVHLTVGNRSGYRGNRSYRSGSVRKKLGNRSLTEPSKPLFSVYRSVLPVYRTGFGGLENRSGSGFLNPACDGEGATRQNPAHTVAARLKRAEAPLYVRDTVRRAGRNTHASQTRSNSLVSGSTQLDLLGFSRSNSLVSGSTRLVLLGFLSKLLS